MRSIGKRNIKKLIAIVDKEYAYNPTQEALMHNIEAKIPAEWYDIWESACQEVDRIVYDRIMQLIHGEVSDEACI